MVVVHDRGPSIIPLLSGLVVAGLARARQGVAGSSELLERAAALAEQQDRLSCSPRLRPHARRLRGSRAGATRSPG